jgi:hypothetical protein
VRIAVLLSAIVLSSSCSAATWGAGLQGFADGYAAANTQPAAVSSQKLMIFGGPNHKTYLGCLTCPKYATDSVENAYGLHGSRYAADSIFNRFGEFGSKYGSHSPCNRYATDPPVIVDEAGRYYGRLTVSTTNADRTRNPNLQAWIAGVCAGD